MSDSPAVDDRYDPDANSARGYELAIRAMREMRIRSGELEASAPREREWQREGKVPLNSWTR